MCAELKRSPLRQPSMRSSSTLAATGKALKRTGVVGGGVNPAWPALLTAAAALNVGGFLLAAADKRAAGRGRRRVAERTFHFLALYGAWPGLALGFLLFRHK